MTPARHKEDWVNNLSTIHGQNDRFEMLTFLTAVLVLTPIPYAYPINMEDMINRINGFIKINGSFFFQSVNTVQETQHLIHVYTTNIVIT